MDNHRSRSPRDVGKRRSRSPSRHSRHHRSTPASARNRPVNLPFKAPTLHRHDLQKYEAVFSRYLDIQKDLVLASLPETEVKGRWKSFVGKWNRGELAEGWYDPNTLETSAMPPVSAIDQGPSVAHVGGSRSGGAIEEDNPNMSGDEDMIGPALPGMEQGNNGNNTSGPSFLNTEDLQVQRELDAEASEVRSQDLRYERKLDRKGQKERLEELVPRAETGSKERMLEKKREKADANRAFASAKTDAGVMEELPESDLMGGDDGGVEGYKKQKKEMERKKNDRELRKEESLRARQEDRAERIREYRAREEQTMSGLVALARAKFG